MQLVRTCRLYCRGWILKWDSYFTRKIRDIRKDRTDRLETSEHTIFEYDKSLKVNKLLSVFN